ncbi:alpha/beta-hydrolase [Atractiella rhizophila]|nr:alpha/beta-hydrolase [Atractiella rhizophila]
MSNLKLKISSPAPFRVSIPQSELDLLETHISLSSSHLPAYTSSLLSSLPTSGPASFEYGIPPSLLHTLVETLKTDYDWRKEEMKINAMGQHFTIDVEEIEDEGSMRMHFVWLKASQTDAETVMVIHGWPGSFFEHEEFAKKLNQKGYNVLVPSLPGYTFSDGPKANPFSFSFTKAATLVDATAMSMGVHKYYIQAGDWGATVAKRLATLFPDRVQALHQNYSWPGDAGYSEPGKMPPDDDLLSFSAEERRGIERCVEFTTRGAGYAMMAGTVPYTIGAALSFSPLSLVAYLAEKYYRWMSPASHSTVSTQKIITLALLYHFTQTHVSCFWFYYIQNHSPPLDWQVAHFTPITQPVAFMTGKHEICWPPKRWLVHAPNGSGGGFKDLRDYRVLERGGHFLALEEPALLAGLVADFFETVKK